VYLAPLVTLLVSPIDAYLMKKSKSRGIPWSVLIIAKITVNSILIAASVVDLAFVLASDQGI
jgi:hypothetical protein